MRILHVIGGLNRGGAETWLVQVLEHIDRRSNRVDLLVHSAEAGAYDEAVERLGVRVLPCPRPSHPLAYALQFRRILRDCGPYDCVHSHIHWYTGYVLLLAAAMGVPSRIAHSHSDTRIPDSGASGLRRAYIWLMRGLIGRFATHGVAVSEHAAASLFGAGWKTDPRWSLCPLGIDLKPFGEQVDRDEVRRELGVSQDALVVGHVGRFAKVKNHKFLVEIAARFCRMEPRAVFLLVGDGPLRPEIEAMVAARGLGSQFVFAGARADVPRILKGAMDCFLLPSLYEGLPLALLEAQAAGLRAVASDTVSSEGDAGRDSVARLSLQESPECWAAALALALAERDRLVPPPNWIAERSVEASAARLDSIYRAC